MLELLKNFGPKINLVFRHLPMRSQHPFAQIAAEAALSAAEQGKFWEMHNLLYENQTHFAFGFFEELAEKLKLDMEKFQRQLDQHTHEKKIESDFQSGIHSGANGTPTLFLSGHKYTGPKTYPEVKKTIEEMILSLREATTDIATKQSNP